MRTINIIDTIEVKKRFLKRLTNLQLLICKLFYITPESDEFYCDLQIAVSVEDYDDLYPGKLLFANDTKDMYKVVSKISMDKNIITLTTITPVDSVEQNCFYTAGNIYCESKK